MNIRLKTETVAGNIREIFQDIDIVNEFQNKTPIAQEI
jgi:hypothetical protein